MLCSMSSKINVMQMKSDNYVDIHQRNNIEYTVGLALYVN